MSCPDFNENTYKVSLENMIGVVCYFLFLFLFFVFEQCDIYRKKLSGKYRVPINHPTNPTNSSVFNTLLYCKTFVTIACYN